MSSNENITKQYIAQCLLESFIFLKSDYQNSEIINLLKDRVEATNSLQKEIVCMKKVTEFSKLAIKFNLIYFYLNSEKIDFKLLSSNYSEHCRLIQKECIEFLQYTSFDQFYSAIDKVKNFKSSMGDVILDKPKIIGEEEPVNLSPGEHSAVSSARIKTKHQIVTPSSQSKKKIVFDDTVNYTERTDTEKFIMEESEKDVDLFQNFENLSTDLIRKLDDFFNKLLIEEATSFELTSFIQMITEQAKMSENFGISTLVTMYKNLSMSLELIRQDKLESKKEVIDAMRACLIVIATLVRNKQVDISHYLNKAEEFGEKLLKISGK